MKGPRRRAELERLGDILSRAGDLLPPASSRGMPRLLRAWFDAAGSTIASRSSPERLDRGVLSVVAATSSWATELSMMSEELRARLAAQGLAVRALRFRVGRVEAAHRPARRAAPPEHPPVARLPEGVVAALELVEDEELRRAIAEAAAHQLGARAARPTATSRPRGARGPRGAG